MTAVLLVITGYIFMHSGDIFGKHRVYYAVLDDVEGLAPSGSVAINGFEIGKVEEIHMHPDNPSQMVIVMNITDETIQIPLFSSVTVYKANLLGAKMIEVALYDTAVLHEVGDTLIIGTRSTMQDEFTQQILPIKEKGVAMLDSIKSFVAVAKSITDSNARSQMSASIEGIKDAVRTVKRAAASFKGLTAGEQAKLDDILANVKDISNNLDSNKVLLRHALDNYCLVDGSVAAGDMITTMANAKSVMVETSSIMTKIKDGDGALILLIKDSAIQQDLEDAKASLAILTADLEVNQHRYVSFSVIARRSNYNLNLTRKEKDRIRDMLHQ
jgi:phospholipid/cholesterol/gamma-HCH transport system substrate-binding protein